MAYEIERKFLVTSKAYREEATRIVELMQGYISVYPRPTVRIRVIGESRALMTVKSANHGIVRHEWEFDIDPKEAREMLNLLPIEALITKTRYYVGPWEVDEFHGRLEGLVVAEIELESADTPLPPCNFIGKEVSDDPRYFNSSLGEAAAPPSVL